MDKINYSDIKKYAGCIYKCSKKKLDKDDDIVNMIVQSGVDILNNKIKGLQTQATQKIIDGTAFSGIFNLKQNLRNKINNF